ncbi:MAG: hypothetical protein ACP5JG_18665 [Anaerolineae bacterium]
MVRELRPDDVVFMYAAEDVEVYDDYGATVVGWGGAHTLEKVRQYEELGIHATGTMWCLTAGAEALHKDPDLREATARDIEGNPIPVPWLPDHVHEGTPSWFGCTNHPTFRAHVRRKVCEAMSGGAHGLHVDDHLGSAGPTVGHGGCFCDHCIAAFERWLRGHSTPEMLSEAGVTSFESFDYRAFVRQFAQTRERYLEIQGEIPLHQAFVDCQLQLAAEHTRQLGELAGEIVTHPVTLSANTCLPHLQHVVVTPSLTYMVGEVAQHAASGTEKLLQAVRAYRMAETIGKPIAATAMGWDWAYVKEHDCEGLVRIWIALSYACGQRLMAPHRMWCFTPEKGTHWYHGPTEAYAPLYRFVREHRDLFLETEMVGPLAPPEGAPERFDTHQQRQALADALTAGDPRPIVAGDQLWVFPRRRTNGDGVVHIVNVAYDPEADVVKTQTDVEVQLPGMIYDKPFSGAVLRSYDGDPVEIEMTHKRDGAIALRLPEQRLWSVVELR